MPRRFRTYILLSLFLHLVLFYFMWHAPAFQFKMDKPYKITWIRLSKGDGGTNLEANLKNSKTLPASTIREQKFADMEQAKDEKGSDLKSKRSETQKTVTQKESQKRTAEDGGVDFFKKQRENKIPQGKTQIDKALARIDQQLTQRQVDLSAAQAKDGDTGQSPWGGHQGNTVDAALIQYYNAVKRKINREWVVSKSDFTGNLRAKIVVLIDSSGNIIRSSYKTTSGNGSFDSSAMRAVRRAAPFPTPPESIRNEALAEGFLIEFNPQRVTGSL